MNDASSKKAIILLSGGLDSATVGAMARAQGYELYALSFSYGQRHTVELDAAKKIANSLEITEHRIVHIDLGAFGGSALTDEHTAVPKARNMKAIGEGIPVTYVPARNTIFLSYALAWAEVLKAYDIFIGVNAVDYSGYPDCRPAFIEAYENMANLATAFVSEVPDKKLTIHTPLLQMSKAEIVTEGTALGVDYAQTISCYDPDEQGKACGACDACILRRKGFEQAKLTDVTRYQPF